MWVYADPYMGLPSYLGHVPWVRILDTYLVMNTIYAILVKSLHENM
jgi:hypothetical protein